MQPTSAQAFNPPSAVGITKTIEQAVPQRNDFKRLGLCQLARSQEKSSSLHEIQNLIESELELV
jgi:hypothetical protein